MAQPVRVEIEVPPEVAELRLPAAVDERLQALLDRQDAGEVLTAQERREAEGLVDVAELLSLLQLRTRRLRRDAEE